MQRFAALPRSRWVLAALVGSLLLNAFLIGLIATDSLRRHGRFGDRSPRVVGFELRQFAERLPKADVERIRAELAGVAPAISERLNRTRQMRAEINRLAAAAAPDRAEIDRRLADLRVEVSAMQEFVQRATFDALLRLPPESRRGLAEPSR